MGHIFSMKNLLIILLLSLAFILASCTSGKIVYERNDNWVIRQNDVPRYFADFDVLYLYPGAFTTNTSPFVPWSENIMFSETREFARYQTTKIFGNKARIFCPFVPMLQHEDYLQLVKSKPISYDETALKPAITNAIEAYNYYFKHFHSPNRPYILFGQGQGALVLYHVLKNMKRISQEDGFVAAYFSGLPPMMREDILQDFEGRDIRPAEGEFDVGVIITWNPVLDFSPIPECALKDAYQMNPINWKTDTTPGPSDANITAQFYNCLASGLKKLHTVNHPCSAVIDPNIGCLRFTPEFTNPELWGVLHFDDNQFHADRHSLFLGNIVENAFTRAKEYRFKFNWRKTD